MGQKASGSMEQAEQMRAEWERVVRRVHQIADGNGLGIDRGIKPVVMALNALGINTCASCIGHLDRLVAGPWIDIAPVETEALKNLKCKVTAIDYHILEGSWDFKDLEGLEAESRNLHQQKIDS